MFDNRLAYFQRLKTLEERFFEKVEKTEACWRWTAGLDKDGYGSITVEGRSVKAHRQAWEMFRGPIPKGGEVCHSCDNPSCVRPEHLWLGSHAENMGDMRRKGRAGGFKKISVERANEIRSLHRQTLKSFCKKGHPLAEDNLYFNKSGKRFCKACITLRRRALTPAEISRLKAVEEALYMWPERI